VNGIWFGFLGVLIFSLTLPATKMTVGYLDPLFVAFARAFLAGLMALVLLAIKGSLRFPPREVLGKLLLTGVGIVVGFPLFTTIALQALPASHGALVLGILPLATAVAGSAIGKEKQSTLFWASSLVGCLLVTGYLFTRSGASILREDAYLLFAVLLAAVGYAQGGVLSKQFGGWWVISWVLVIYLPVTIVISAGAFPPEVSVIPPSAWFGLGYTSVFSMFVGFLFWYRGMEQSGIGKIGQFQLLQPFMTFAFSALLLAETLEWTSIAVAVLVTLCIYVGRLQLKGAHLTPSSP
jgi:drug/metabolite transporter (DMT)-like permease